MILEKTSVWTQTAKKTKMVEHFNRHAVPILACRAWTIFEEVEGGRPRGRSVDYVLPKGMDGIETAAKTATLKTTTMLTMATVVQARPAGRPAVDPGFYS